MVLTAVNQRSKHLRTVHFFGTATKEMMLFKGFGNNVLKAS